MAGVYFMEEAMTVLGKIAEALSHSSDPFEMENARLAALPHEMTRVESPTPRHALGPGIWLDYQADAGVETVAEPAEDGDGLRLHLSDRGESPWYSLSCDIPAAPLRGGRYFGQVLRCSSSGPVRFRVCLRYILADGFRDVFARNVVVLTGGPHEDLVVIKLDPDLADQATRAEVLLFFDGRSFDMTLHAAESLLI